MLTVLFLLALVAFVCTILAAEDAVLPDFTGGGETI